MAVNPKRLRVDDMYKNSSGLLRIVDSVDDDEITFREEGGRVRSAPFRWTSYWRDCMPVSVSGVDAIPVSDVMGVDPTKLKPGDKISHPDWPSLEVKRVDSEGKIIYFTDEDDVAYGHGFLEWWEKCKMLPADPVTTPAIVGVGPTTETTTNAAGGSQSAIPYRCDLLPARASLGVAHILHEGAEKYGDDNWRKIEINDHVNHALTHLFARLSGDKQDDHLGHAACRLMMALELDLTK